MAAEYTQIPFSGEVSPVSFGGSRSRAETSSPYPFHPRKLRATGRDTLEVEALWRAIEAVSAPAAAAPPPPFHSTKARPSAAGVTVMVAIWRRRIAGAGLMVGAGVGLAIEPSASTAWAAGAVLGAYLAVSLPKRAAEVAQAAREIEKQFQEGLRGWWEQGSSGGFVEAKAQLEAAREALSQLALEERRRIDADPQNRRAKQFKQYLRSRHIKGDKIKGIGPCRLARLTSHGVESADDVLANRVSSVPGIGPVTTRALLSWRARIEGEFVYDPETDPKEQARIATIKDDIAQHGAPLRAQLQDGPRRLAALAASVESRRSVVDPELHELHARWEQAGADLRICGRRLNPPPTPPSGAGQKNPHHPRRRQAIGTVRLGFA